MKLEKTEKFILQVSFELVPESGDYIHACKACGRKAWRISEVKHAPRCSVAEVLRELGMSVQSVGGEEMVSASMSVQGVGGEEMKIIGLCGYSRTGKDTAAANMPGWTRFAFADALKEDLHSFADLLHVQISRFTPEEKEKFRPLMVAWGATARTFSPGFWIRRLRTAIDLFPPENPKIVITDVRYRDEVDAIYRWGGKVVYIERPGYSPGNDEEKRSFKEIDVKLPVVVNDSTPEELGKRVLGVCEKWEKER